MAQRSFANLKFLRSFSYLIRFQIAFADAPRLTDVTREDIEILSSRSGPVAAAARRQHNEYIKRHNQPWWQSLCEDNDETDLDRIRDKVREDGLAEEAQQQF